jgi:hypothetical protein
MEIPQESVARLQATADLYYSIMGEIKLRIGAIENASMGKTGLPGQFAREFCFLQLRMICELLALGCLVAHNDIQESTPLRDKWHAGEILNRLERLHADFYPRPIRLVPSATSNTGNWEPVDHALMTKSELLRLYGECGKEVHKGELNKLLSARAKPPATDFIDIKQVLDKIVRLLASHLMITVNEKFALYCVLWNKDDGGNHQVTISVSFPEGETLPGHEPSESSRGP